MRCIIYSHQWLRTTLAFVVKGVFLYTYTSVGLSTLLVSTGRAMRRPLHCGTSDRTGSTFFVYTQKDYKHSHTDARWLQIISIMGISNKKTLEALCNYQGYDVVIRKMISKEIDRQYSFMKWNIAVQTFLIGAITQLKNDKILWVIIVLGLLASISSFFTYWASEAKIKRILYFWDGYRKYKGLSYFVFPPVWSNPTEDVILDDEISQTFGDFKLGWSRKISLKFILPKFSPFIFLIAWGMLLYISLFK